MPASARTAHVSLDRGCPACGHRRCPDPAECLNVLTSSLWGDCNICAGSGFAGDYSPLDVFCPVCTGSGLIEYVPGEVTPDEITEDAKDRYAAVVARLVALLPQHQPSLAVAS